MKEIDYKNLTRNHLIANQPDVYKIVKQNVDFYFKICLKGDSNKLIVFSNGALNRKKTEPPVFMRSTWHEDINGNCIFIDDRTLHGNQLPLGWGIGTKDRYYLKDYSDIIITISKLLGINANNVYYYGSSAGGYMSIALATYHYDSTAIVNNPQTYVYNYTPFVVRKLFDELFPGMTREEILKKYTRRLSVSSLMKIHGNLPRIYYYQNRLYTPDIESHFNVFRNAINNSGMDNSRVKYILYDDEYAEHNPLSRSETLYNINSIIR